MLTLLLIGIALALQLHFHHNSYRRLWPWRDRSSPHWLLVTIIDPTGRHHFHTFPAESTVSGVERHLKVSPNSLYTQSLHPTNTPLKYISTQPILICKFALTGGMQSQLIMFSPQGYFSSTGLPSPRVGRRSGGVIRLGGFCICADRRAAERLPPCAEILTYGSKVILITINGHSFQHN